VEFASLFQLGRFAVFCERFRCSRERDWLFCSTGNLRAARWNSCTNRPAEPAKIHFTLLFSLYFDFGVRIQGLIGCRRSPDMIRMLESPR
jgi:hypothetical protein